MRTPEEISEYEDKIKKSDDKSRAKYRRLAGFGYNVELYMTFCDFIKQINAIRMHDFIMDSIPKRVPHMPAMAFADEDFVKKLQKGRK